MRLRSDKFSFREQRRWQRHVMAMSCLAGLGLPLYVVYASPLSFSVFRFFLTHSLSNRSHFRPFLRVPVPSSAILETDSGHVTMPRVEYLLHLHKFLFSAHLQFSVRRSIVEVCKCQKQVQSHFSVCCRLSPFCTKVFKYTKNKYTKNIIHKKTTKEVWVSYIKYIIGH